MAADSSKGVMMNLVADVLRTAVTADDEPDEVQVVTQVCLHPFVPVLSLRTPRYGAVAVVAPTAARTQTNHQLEARES